MTAVFADNFFEQPVYGLWVSVRNGKPLAVIKQTSATAWFLDGAGPINLKTTYGSLAKERPPVAAEVFHRTLGVGVG